MDISRLTEKDWEIFEENHKGAYNFLLELSNLRELDSLTKSASQLNDWQKKRVLELATLIYGDKEN